MREQFRVAIAPYVLDAAETAATTTTEDGAALQEQGKKVHGKRRASERLSSSPAARGLLRAPKRARLGSSPGERGEPRRAASGPRGQVPLARVQAACARPSGKVMHAFSFFYYPSAILIHWRNDAEAAEDFLQTIYDAEVGPRRFTVDAVLRSLEDVSVAGACVIECGEQHLGRRFQLC